MDEIYAIRNPVSQLSPSLVLFRPIIESNLRAMIDLAGSPDRIRPHVKTHKMAELVRLVERAGVHKHKVATIAEAEMTAAAGGRDVLIAYPIVGPNIARVAALMRTYPDTVFHVLVDDLQALEALSRGIGGENPPAPLSVLVDLEIGMGRTGIAPGPEADALYRRIDELPHVVPGGLSGYDGQIRDFDPIERVRSAQPGVDAVLGMRDRLVAQGLPVPRIVLGGTPTFPVHAANSDPIVECSPGTSLLHDAGYASKFPDLPFRPAALLFTRVISRPRPGRITLDLGHKAVAADPVGDRLVLPDIPDARFVGQSEEHLVVETSMADRLPPGTATLAIPIHVCPTVALHRKAYVIDGGELVDVWEVSARDRVIGI
ncbi:MAG: D-TA family PLP-dependent enzyme [Isosphaeraceae bacterium]|nr:D-TA family PLP-dependent enzyme [Isosphaeraceae bacterium]